MCKRNGVRWREKRRETWERRWGFENSSRRMEFEETGGQHYKRVSKTQSVLSSGIGGGIDIIYYCLQPNGQYCISAYGVHVRQDVILTALSIAFITL